MSSSPMKICNTSSSDDDDDMYLSLEPAICDCHNQLGHYDSNGNPREILPDLCRRTMRISVENTPKDDIFGSLCDCQNQLGHYDWNGNPRENLPDLCRRTMGISVENMLISSKDDKISTFGSEQPDPEWEQVILRRANRDRQSDLAINAGENVESAGEASIVVNKRDSGDLTHKKSRKHRRENTNTWTSKKNKAMDFRVKFRVGKKQSVVKIYAKITLPGL